MAPPLKRILPEIFLMTFHLNSHRKTDIKLEMLSGVQNGNGTPHDKYDIRGIAHARTNGKDDIFMQRRLVQNFTFIFEWGQGTCRTATMFFMFFMFFMSFKERNLFFCSLKNAFLCKMFFILMENCSF